VELVEPQKLIRQALKWEPFRLIPIGDIHYAGKGGACDLKALEATIKWGVENNCYFIGMGDYQEFASPSNRMNMKGLYDSAEQIIDAMSYQLERELLDALRPSKDRWLGLLEGHHFTKHLSGQTTDQNIAEALNAPFLGNCAMVRLTFQHGIGNSRMNCFIWAHHGAGYSSAPGTILNKLAGLIAYYPQVDVMLMGHQHKLAEAPLPGIGMTPSGRPQMRQKLRRLVATGSYMRGYQQGSLSDGRAGGSYVEKRLLPPTAIGSPVITITPIKHKMYNELDLRVSS
jgi:hypothetical protein